MKILITGGTGFIGRNVVGQLGKTDHNLRCLVRKTSRTDHLKGAKIELAYGDVTDKDSVLEAMKGCDWVINLANVYSFWEPNRILYRMVNVDGTKNVMEAALETGISKVVHISTVATFGRPSDSPFNEESPVGPVRFSEYGRTKYEGDLIAWKMYKERRLPLVVVFPSAVLGPGDPKATGRYINDIVNRRIPARVFENSAMTFVHVKDVADAIVRAAEKENNLGEKYIIGKYRLTFGEINKLVSEISGVPLPRFALPDFMSTVNAGMMTLLSRITKKAPLWGLSTDQAKTMKEGFVADGSKAERELGITYTPIRRAIEEMIGNK